MQGLDEPKIMLRSQQGQRVSHIMNDDQSRRRASVKSGWGYRHWLTHTETVGIRMFSGDSRETREYIEAEFSGSQPNLASRRDIRVVSDAGLKRLAGHG